MALTLGALSRCLLRWLGVSARLSYSWPEVWEAEASARALRWAGRGCRSGTVTTGGGNGRRQRKAWAEERPRWRRQRLNLRVVFGNAARQQERHEPHGNSCRRFHPRVPSGFAHSPAEDAASHSWRQGILSWNSVARPAFDCTSTLPWWQLENSVSHCQANATPTWFGREI